METRHWLQQALYRFGRSQAGITPLPGTENGYGVFFSPDGQSIGRRKVACSVCCNRFLEDDLTRGMCWIQF